MPSGKFNHPIMGVPKYKTVAIVGRPNVGKSALFNRLVGKSIAIVHDQPGVTRDRLVSLCKKGAEPFELMDTGGIGEVIADEFNDQVKAEAQLALEIADLILFVVDGFQGPTPVDAELARTFRKSTKPLILVVNKMDSDKRRQHGAEFSRMGFKDTLDVSAAHGIGIGALTAKIDSALGLKKPEPKAKDGYTPQEEEEVEEVKEIPRAPLKLAIVGRPNAGKSSLVNSLLGQQRTIVSEIAGTTRDSVDIPCEFNGKPYILIDTAGLRRKAKIHDAVESFSASQAARSIRRSDLCILMVDATEMTMQDRKVAQLILKEQKPCIILLNKFDLYHPTARLKDRKEELKETADREFFFMPYVPKLPVSAKENQFLDKIFKSVERIYEGAQDRPGTGALNRLLHGVVDRSPAALGRSGRSFNLLYATFLKEDDPTPIPVPHVVLFANRTEQLQDSFLRHLESVLREQWPAEGLPMKWSVRGKKKEKDENK